MGIMPVALALLLWMLTTAETCNANPAIMEFGGGGLTSGAATFTYGGEGAGACSGDICRGGTCTGTTPTGTCTLEANAVYLRSSADGGSGNNGLVSCIYDYEDVTITAGTVTCQPVNSGTATTYPEGSALIFRVRHLLTMSGGTISMAGLGGKGATGGACASVNAGKPGGGTGLTPGGAAGSSSGTAGSVGLSYVENWLWSLAQDNAAEWSALRPYMNLSGAGGGACPSSGQTPAASFTVWPSLGASGGGGGGCTAACSGTCGAGGRGGGTVIIDALSTNVTAGTIDVSGSAGTTGGGGGGGGGIALVGNWSTPSVAALTITKSAGAAGGSPPTNCGAGAAGVAGIAYMVRPGSK